MFLLHIDNGDRKANGYIFIQSCLQLREPGLPPNKRLHQPFLRLAVFKRELVSAYKSQRSFSYLFILTNRAYLCSLRHVY